MIKNTLFTFIVILLFISLIGCSSKQDIYISNTGEGTVSIDINLDKILTSYVGDLLGGFSNLENKDINLFDTHKINSIITELESVFLTDIISDSSESLHLELSFLDPGKIFDEPEVSGAPNLISFSTRRVNNKDRKKISLYLSKGNFNTIMSLVGMKDSEILDTFGPQDNPYSESEYLDLMEFLFEEYESSYGIRSIVKASEILINLKVDGQIVDCYGCNGSGSDVLIKIPLLDIVTLEEPIEIFVEWE
ncbi:MAG: hypothetical protein PF693_19025 [Spirochaetia bacterium]|jgi:hypothetical protein|nr:hypothetical protein [Spirochaetia bacterium]